MNRIKILLIFILLSSSIINCALTQEQQDLAESYKHHAEALRTTGRSSESVPYYNAAIQINPSDIAAWEGRGRAFSISNPAQSIHDYTVALSKAHSLPITLTSAVGIGELYHLRGTTYHAIGNTHQALDDLQTAARLGNIKAQTYLVQNGVYHW